jgi:hypothetical protein
LYRFSGAAASARAPGDHLHALQSARTDPPRRQMSTESPPQPQPQRPPAARRLETVAPADMPEVAEIAFGLFQQDQARTAEQEDRRLALEAASEAGVPAEYMERAAEIFHQRRVETVLRRRRRTTILVAVAAVVALTAAALWTAQALLEQPIPVAVVERFDGAPAGRWTLDVNPESRASLAFESQEGRDAAVIRVDRFGARPGDGTYWANLDSIDGPKQLDGLRAVSFAVRGSGLGQVRLYLEGSATERWRSPPVAVTGEWREQRIALDQFERQTRASAAESWRTVAYRRPATITTLSFKAGYFINDAAAHGEIAVDDLRIE